MKRTGMLVSLILLLCFSVVPSKAVRAVAPVSCMDCLELPWETVDAVIKRVDELYAEFTYSQLVEWYHVSLLTVEQCGSGYWVTIYDEDGIVIAGLIENI
jgi:hypothetical protein